MYELLKEFCLDNGKYRKYYYGLINCKDNINHICYLDNNKNHKHSNIWSCVYDFCKKNNIKEIEILVELIENGYVYEVMSAPCLVYNYEIYNNLPHCINFDEENNKWVLNN